MADTQLDRFFVGDQPDIPSWFRRWQEQLEDFLALNGRDVGGIKVGSAGTPGSVYDGYLLVWGDDFDTPDLERWTLTNLRGRYASSPPQLPFRRNTVTKRPFWTADQSFIVDPTYRGMRSESATPLGYEQIAVKNSMATFNIAAPAVTTFLPAEHTGSVNSQASGLPRLLTGGLKSWPSFALSAEGDWILECCLRVAAASGDIQGYWMAVWTTCMGAWPDFGEFDLLETKKGAGFMTWNTTINVSDTDGDPLTGGGTNVGTVIASAVTIPVDRKIITRVVKTAGRIRLYDDVATEGVMVLRADYTTAARVNRLRAAHEIRIDALINHGYDSTTWDGTDFPTTFEIDWIRAWTPVGGGLNTEILKQIDAPTLATPGGVWDYQLPTSDQIHGFTPNFDQIIGCYDNADNPGHLNSSLLALPRLPAGMVINATTRAITGRIPKLSGGRTGLLFLGSKAGGGPASRAIKLWDVAPAPQGTLLNDRTIQSSTTIGTITIAQADFHSGNLGPHTYSVTKVEGGSWLTITPASPAYSVALTGTAPANGVTTVIDIAATNTVGQTTTARRTLTAAAAAVWHPSQWTTLLLHQDPSDLTTQFSDEIGNTPAVAGSSVLRSEPKVGIGVMRKLDNNGNAPTLVLDTDLTPDNYVWNFVAASVQGLFTDSSYLMRHMQGANKAFTFVGIVKRGAAGEASTMFCLNRNDGSGIIDFDRFYISSASNYMGHSKQVAGTPTNVAEVGPAVTWTTNTWRVVALVCAGTTTAIRVNGVETLTATTHSVASQNFAGLSVGAVLTAVSTWATGHNSRIGEFFYSSDATATSNVTNAEAYLMAKYGIA